MNYWKECISIAVDELGLALTDEQIDYLADAVEGGHENYGMATGRDVADANFISDDKRALDKMKLEKDQHERWVNDTKPCRSCTTTGVVKDGWGRNMTCFDCDGKGRVRN